MLNRPPHTTRFRAALVCALGITLLGLATAGCEDDTAASDSGRRQSATRADLATDGDGGKTLRLGEPTSITYKRGSDHMRGALRVTAVSVREGTHAELKKAGTEPSDVRTTQPYYVTMTFENVGENSLHYPFLNTRHRTPGHQRCGRPAAHHRGHRGGGMPGQATRTTSRWERRSPCARCSWCRTAYGRRW
ncbi:hypothetical protein SANTM175S_03393 [Streptomyces antimycoticus]